LSILNIELACFYVLCELDQLAVCDIQSTKACHHFWFYSVSLFMFLLAVCIGCWHVCCPVV